MLRLAKLVLITALLLMVAGSVTMLLRGPAMEYTVTCTRAPSAQCILARRGRLAASAGATIVPLTSVDAASVRYLSPRRGQMRVLLYLDGRPQARFAAEFEGGDAVEDANRAARRLNAFFRHPDSQAVRVDARPPRLNGILSWLAFAVMTLLVFVAVRAILRPTAS